MRSITYKFATFAGLAAVFLFASLCSAYPLNRLSTQSLRGIYGTEGLNVDASKFQVDPTHSLPAVEDINAVNSRNNRAKLNPVEFNVLTGSGASEASTAQFQLSGDPDGIVTRSKNSSPLIARTGPVSVDPAAPFYIDMTITPARTTTSEGVNSSGVIQLPGIQGVTGGEFVIDGSKRKTASAGFVSMGGFNNTSGSVRIRSNQ